MASTLTLAVPARRLLQRLGVSAATVLITVAALLAGVVGAAVYVTRPAAASHRSAVPQNAAMEQQLGVRFSRIAVVGDGGLITLSYVVLDVEKATVFQTGLAHPPVLTSEQSGGSTTRISVMKQGHLLRPGATYYLVYENTRGALRPGDHATVRYGLLRLANVPVL